MNTTTRNLITAIVSAVVLPFSPLIFVPLHSLLTDIVFRLYGNRVADYQFIEPGSFGHLVLKSVTIIPAIVALSVVLAVLFVGIKAVLSLRKSYLQGEASSRPFIYGTLCLALSIAFSLLVHVYLPFTTY